MIFVKITQNKSASSFDGCAFGFKRVRGVEFKIYICFGESFKIREGL